jgi:hypothetical protein
MNTHKKLSLPIYEYVRGVYKGSGETLGEIASEARAFESDMNAFIDGLEAMEGLIR